MDLDEKCVGCASEIKRGVSKRRKLYSPSTYQGCGGSGLVNETISPPGLLKMFPLGGNYIIIVYAASLLTLQVTIIIIFISVNLT